MAKKPGNPKNGRRLQGVPKAGPLFVNGVEAPKGNVQKAVSQMYRSASRSLAEANEPAAVTIGIADHVWDTDLSLACHHCGEGAMFSETIAVDNENGWWWHMEPRRFSSKSCRYIWVQRHHPPER